MFIKHLIFIIFLTYSSAFSKELKPITIQLSWFDQFQFAGYYMAKEKGFYKDVGLDVTIKPFKFGIDIPKEVSLGTYDFAVGRETLLLESKKEEKIAVLYALFQATPLILLSTKESKIDKIEDFIGKKIMTTIDDESEVSLKSMISSHNIKIDQLNFIKHSHNIEDLINKKTDVISAYVSKAPFNLQKKGIKYNIFDPKKYGFDMYSDFLYTSRKLIDNDITTVESFRNASLKGWEYAYSHIPESADVIINKYNTLNLSKEALIFEGKELKKLSYFKSSKLGEIKKEKIQRIYDLYNVMGLITPDNSIENFVYYDKKIGNLSFTEKEKKYLLNKKSIKACIVSDMMPYSDFVNGKLTGIVYDYINLIEDKIDIPIFILKTKSFSQSLENIKNNKCDFIPALSKTQEREKIVNFTQSYTQVPYVLVTKKNVPFISDIKNINNKKIAVVNDFSIFNIVKNKYKNINLVKVSNLEKGLQKVKDGEVFAYIGTNATIWYKLQNELIDGLKISAKLDELSDIRIAVNKNDIQLGEILNKFVSHVDKNTKEVILNKWLIPQYNKEFDFALLGKILTVILLLLLGILYRQRLLNKMNRSLILKVEEKTKELMAINNELEDRIRKAVDENIKKDRILSQQSKMAAIGEMMENVAHQWRQPLSLITTGSSGLKIKKELNMLEDEFLLETLDSIIKSATDLSKTIDDFRDFFEPTNAKENFSLIECCQNTLDLLDNKIKDSQIRIINNIEDITITAFKKELIQVIISILNNSKDIFVENNERIRLIFIDASRDSNNNIIIRIKDNAGGVSEKILEKIYEPYFTTKHKSKGAGIALYRCEEIISKHMNGKIESINRKYYYEGIEYKGLETIITLPL